MFPLKVRVTFTLDILKYKMGPFYVHRASNIIIIFLDLNAFACLVSSFYNPSLLVNVKMKKDKSF